MRRRLEQAGELLRQSLNLLPSVLIGSAIASPAFAATDIALDELRIPILLGSAVLLVIALVLKVRRRRTAQSAPPQSAPPVPPRSEGIGRYRLQLGRGDAD